MARTSPSTNRTKTEQRRPHRRKPRPEPPDESDGRDAELVEAAIGRGWSLSVRRKLALALGVGEEHVDRWRAQCLARAAKSLGDAAPGELRAELLLRVRWTQGAALAGKDFGSLTRLLALEARMLGLDELRIQVAGATAPVTSPDDLSRERLDTLRRLRGLPAAEPVVIDVPTAAPARRSTG